MKVKCLLPLFVHGPSCWLPRYNFGCFFLRMAHIVACDSQKSVSGLHCKFTFGLAARLWSLYRGYRYTEDRLNRDFVPYILLWHWPGWKMLIVISRISLLEDRYIGVLPEPHRKSLYLPYWSLGHLFRMGAIFRSRSCVENGLLQEPILVLLYLSLGPSSEDGEWPKF